MLSLHLVSHVIFTVCLKCSAILFICFFAQAYEVMKSLVVLSLQSFLAESMFIMATVLHLGKSGIPTKVMY